MGRNGLQCLCEMLKVNKTLAILRWE